MKFILRISLFLSLSLPGLLSMAAANCPGGDTDGPLSSHYQRSHQQFDARPGCIDPDYKIDVGVVPAVQMGEYMITDYSKQSHILTAGLSPCLAITFYDPKTKTGMLAHLPPGAMYEKSDILFDKQRPNDPHDKKYFESMVAEFEKRGIPRERIQVGVYGNYETRNGISQTLTSVFKNSGLTNIKMVNVLDKGEVGDPNAPGAGSLKILDLKTGQVSSFQKERFWDLDLSNWKQRIARKLKEWPKEGVTHLLPTPGSLDYTAAKNSKTVTPLGVQ